MANNPCKPPRSDDPLDSTTASERCRVNARELEVKCPDCGSSLSGVTAEMVGEVRKCPHCCGKSVIRPTASQADSQPTPRARVPAWNRVVGVIVIMLALYLSVG